MVLLQICLQQEMHYSLMAETSYVVQKFEKASHDREAFSCGVPTMDRWFKQSISEQIRQNRVRVWCAVDKNGKVAGFYGLCAHSIEPEKAAALKQGKERHPIPTVYLVALAVDKNLQGQGLGGALMADAIAKALEISEAIGVKAIILDVSEDKNFARRMAFYKKVGFQHIDPINNQSRLYLTIKDAAASYCHPRITD